MDLSQSFVSRAIQVIDSILSGDNLHGDVFRQEILAKRVADFLISPSSTDLAETLAFAKNVAKRVFAVLDKDPKELCKSLDDLREHEEECQIALGTFNSLLSLFEQPISAKDFVYSWSPRIAPSREILIEDDIRDALQAATGTRPTLEERKYLLNATSAIGIKYTFLGFPAASERESNECASLVQHIAENSLPITPILMSRAVETDLYEIIKIQSTSTVPVLADLYISTSQLRNKIENWDFELLVGKLKRVGEIAMQNGIQYRIAFEDSSRAPPSMLREALAVAMSMKPHSIVLNDTVGELNPEGTSELVQFVKALMNSTDSAMPLAWHGHNDKGLALANSIAAINSGATIVSGTLLGIGERTGNIPLEQLIFLLHSSGQHTFKIENLVSACHAFGKITGHVVPINQPLVGEDVFTTSTGTHAAAIHKAKRLGNSFVDLAFSGVEASALARSQRIVLGPNSGKRSVEAFLEQVGLRYSASQIELLLAHCKTLTNPITTAQEVLDIISKASAP